MEGIENVAFELSNRCNYSAIHPECPTEAKADPIFLPTHIILEAIDYMGKTEWEGNVYFNIYNEPMIDPRLYYLCAYVRDHSKANIQIFTNGWYLNNQLYQEMMFWFGGRLGFTVSVYSDSEEERLRKIEGLNVQRIYLDARKRIYDCPKTAKGPCYAPLIYPMVNCKAQLVLCCMDYQYHVVLEQLGPVTFEEAIASLYRRSTCDDLKNGIRSFEVCQQCPHQGWGVPTTEWSKWQ